MPINIFNTHITMSDFKALIQLLQTNKKVVLKNINQLDKQKIVTNLISELETETERKALEDLHNNSSDDFYKIICELLIYRLLENKKTSDESNRKCDLLEKEYEKKCSENKELKEKLLASQQIDKEYEKKCSEDKELENKIKQCEEQLKDKNKQTINLQQLNYTLKQYNYNIAQTYNALVEEYDLLYSTFERVITKRIKYVNVGGKYVAYYTPHR